MKRTALKTLALFMALNILFSATGFAMFEHTCHSIGLTSHSFFDADFCEMESQAVDSTNNELSFKQNNCCETDAHFKNIDLKSGSSFEKVALPTLVFAQIASTINFNYSFPVVNKEKKFFPPTNAPPDTGRAILLKSQRFLI